MAAMAHSALAQAPTASAGRPGSPVTCSSAPVTPIIGLDRIEVLREIGLSPAAKS